MLISNSAGSLMDEGALPITCHVNPDPAPEERPPRESDRPRSISPEHHQIRRRRHRRGRIRPSQLMTSAMGYVIHGQGHLARAEKLGPTMESSAARQDFTHHGSLGRHFV